MKAVLDLKISRIVKETSRVIRIELVSVDGSTLPLYQAGAHVELKLPNGLMRQYSLCRLPTTGMSYEIAVLKDLNSRGGSLLLHQMKVGDRLQASYPQNHFLLKNPRKTAILLGAGIGITPLIPMAQMLAKTGVDFALHYSAKSPASAAFYDQLNKSEFADKVHWHFSDANSRLDIALLLKSLVSHPDLYVCGPRQYIEEIMNCAKVFGWPEERLHKEFFTGAKSPLIDQTPREMFQVKLASSGQMIDVPPGVSITEALEMNGIDIPISCEEGWCGTCMTRVIDGVPDHRDTFLSPQEHAQNSLIMPCCSRSRSDVLVLDI